MTAQGPYDPHRLCANGTAHNSHNWSNNTEALWCPGRTEDIEATMFGDQTIPDGYCDNSAPHNAHIWYHKEEARRCPGSLRPVEPNEAVQIVGRNLKPGERRRIENCALPVRWADRAMFKAEPIKADEGPKVYLLWMTPDPLGAIAAACKMYKGEVVRDLSTVTDQERLDYFAQVSRTKLKAPFEFVKFHFMIEGVTRSFTHQMVRQRTAVYAQESLRFAVVTDGDTEMPVGLPPSLSGLPEDDPAVVEWRSALSWVEEAYGKLINLGVPAEDARGLLPHNVLTRLHYSTDLRALLDHAGNRLCTQAQFEWRLVFTKIVEAIRGAHNLNPYMTAPDGQPSTSAVHMADVLGNLFRPVCYATGNCEFMADFDRACSIRDRVQTFHRYGVPSSEWGKPWEEVHPNPNGLHSIQPSEWALNPNAARER